MNVVDSSGWLEYFAGGTNASFFAPLIKETDTLVVPTVCMVRSVQTSLSPARRRRRTASRRDHVTWHYRRFDPRDRRQRRRPFHLNSRSPWPDSIILATTRAHGATLWTQDADFEGIGSVQVVKKK